MFAFAFVCGCAGGHGSSGSADDAASLGSDAGSEGGSDSAADDDDSGDGTAGALDDPEAIGPTGLRRLTIAELDASLQLALGITADRTAPLLTVLPGDGSTPFDNDYTIQSPSAPLVEGMFAIAEDLSAAVLDDPALRSELLGCVPSGPDDAACLRTLADRVGRRLLRRPLEASELDELAAFAQFGAAEDDFDVGAALVLQTLLLDAEMLYRVERGEAVAGHDDLVHLGDVEIASRLSFLLWGSGPDDALLDRAAAGELGSAAEIREAARELLQDQRGLAQLQRMHAMWLGYEEMGLDPTLAESLRHETDKLIERALVDGDWLAMFTSEDTWIDATLAEHYDMTLPGGSAGWVEYPDIRRRGLLAHGSVLSTGAKFGDTSPTERGKAVWTRFLCNEIPPPPPDVDTGLPPSGGPANACKTERYDMRTKTECQGCHGILDSIGFGLENYGAAGEWRTVEPDKPSCAIDGEGELAGVGEFAGAGALGDLLVDTGQLERCFVKSYYQFAIGRRVDDTDLAMVDELGSALEDDDDVLALVLAYVGSEGFRHRRMPSE
ncbi:MAG TPA: DUF1588 domain-containing protein [Nannocystaceae bacterium]|nr:DUF1588 domain-containing protein [Nannocystaceae bacterium]